MRIALNLLPIGRKGGGIATFARVLPGALLSADPGVDLTVVVNADPPGSLTGADWAGDVRWVRLPVALGSRGELAAQLAGLPALATARRWDVIHSVANVGPPRVPGTASVITIHDLIWLHAGTAWDTAEAVAAMRRFAVRSARWATRVQASSQATADDVRRVAPSVGARLDIVPLGVGAPTVAPTPEVELRARLRLGGGPVLLTVAQKRPYKNLEAAVRTLLVHENAVLVLPGESTPYEEELHRLAEKLGVLDRVRFLGWVDDADLEGLYGLAACVIVPSRYEGFGLPVLEAMVRGAPVACADALSLPEVAGDAAVLFDPLDQPSVDAAVGRVLMEDRARLGAAGRARAAVFTWDRTAQLTLESYRRAAG